MLYHDELAAVSTPLYFHGFIEHATADELRFISEAELSDSQMRDVPTGVGEQIADLSEDVIVREQYLDFFSNRMFRQALLKRGCAITRASTGRSRSKGGQAPRSPSSPSTAPSCPQPSRSSPPQ